MKKPTPQKEVPLKIEEKFHTEETVIIDDPANRIIEEPDLFYFTNASNEDWTTQWNKIRYTFPARKTVRLAIKDATPLETQSIRKAFAKRFAHDQFMKSAEFQRLIKVVNGAVSTYDEKLLQPWINQCLVPLPKDRIGVQETHENQEANFKVSKAIGQKDSLNEVFKEDANYAASNPQL